MRKKLKFAVHLNVITNFSGARSQISRCSNATVGVFHQALRESHCTNLQDVIKTWPCGVQRQGRHAKMGWVKHGGEYHLYYWGGSWA